LLHTDPQTITAAEKTLIRSYQVSFIRAQACATRPSVRPWGLEGRTSEKHNTTLPKHDDPSYVACTLHPGIHPMSQCFENSVFALKATYHDTLFPPCMYLLHIPRTSPVLTDYSKAILLPITISSQSDNYSGVGFAKRLVDATANTLGYVKQISEAQPLHYRINVCEVPSLSQDSSSCRSG
jgi:hypothetical protein